MNDTQQSRALVRIREMVLRGQLTPGRKLSEPNLAEALGISRTPVRLALRVLAQEGLLAESPSRGYVVREFADKDVNDALDIRAMLEGMAARRIAQKGASNSFLQKMRHLLEAGDTILSLRRNDDFDTAEYAEMNVEFHRLLIVEADSAMITDEVERMNRVPFVHPHAAVVITGAGRDVMFKQYMYAHLQHHSVVDALEASDGARADAIMREHVNPSRSVRKVPHPDNGALHPVHALRARL